MDRGFTPEYPPNFSPVSWRQYFDFSRIVVVRNERFRVFCKGRGGLILILLHAGGSSALTWALFTRDISRKIHCQVIAIDIRGHGASHSRDDDDLSLKTLVQDIVGILGVINPNNEPVVFIGHLLGAALAVYCSTIVKSCIGICAIDLVEGYSHDCLSTLRTINRNRPAKFSNISHAIEWSVKSGMIHNLAAAKVAIPGLIINSETNLLAATELQYNIQPSRIGQASPTAKPIPSPFNTGPVIKIANDLSYRIIARYSKVVAPYMKTYYWCHDISKSETYWHRWFLNVSNNFLRTPVPKLLVLANIAGLDKTLAIGCLQGSFDVELMPRCGQAIQEDMPELLAKVIATFLLRSRLAVPADHSQLSNSKN